MKEFSPSKSGAFRPYYRRDGHANGSANGSGNSKNGSLAVAVVPPASSPPAASAAPLAAPHQTVIDGEGPSTSLSAMATVTATVTGTATSGAAGEGKGSGGEDGGNNSLPAIGKEDNASVAAATATIIEETKSDKEKNTPASNGNNNNDDDDDDDGGEKESKETKNDDSAIHPNGTAVTTSDTATMMEEEKEEKDESKTISEIEENNKSVNDEPNKPDKDEVEMEKSKSMDNTKKPIDLQDTKKPNDLQEEVVEVDDSDDEELLTASRTAMISNDASNLNPPSSSRHSPMSVEKDGNDATNTDNTAAITTMVEKKKLLPISTSMAAKRPRDGHESVGTNDITPRNCNGGGAMMQRMNSEYTSITHNKRSRLAEDADQYETAHHGIKFKGGGYHPHHALPPQHPHPHGYHHHHEERRQYMSQIKVIPSMDSVDVEDRQDKSHGRINGGRGDYDDRRCHDRNSFSPTHDHRHPPYDEFYNRRRRTYSESHSREERRDSYDDLRHLDPTFSASYEDKGMQQTNSWTEYPEPASLYAAQSMSWEVPPALGSICSFGQLKNELTSSPPPEMDRSTRGPPSGYVNEDDVEDDELPPLPGDDADNNNPSVRRPFLAQRPTNKIFEPMRQLSSPVRDGRHHPDPQYPHQWERYPPHHLSRGRSPPPMPPPHHHQSRYPEARYPDMRGPGSYYECDRRYDREQRPGHDPHREQERGYNRDRDLHRDHDRRPISHYRDPHGSPPRYDYRHPEHYSEEGHHHRQQKPWSSPPRRSQYLSYPNDTPGGISRRDSPSIDSRDRMSYPSRSMDDLEEAPSFSLAFRPSFSWEAPLQRSPCRDDAVEGNADEDDGGVIQLKDQCKIMNALAMRNEIRTLGNPNSPAGLLLLLAMPQDRHCLSETLCIIRSNVEVFTATEADISAPAPGRKRPVQLGQVGLRCVYCRLCRGDRVKRATCFPSSIKRIYRAVIDMKLDHFKSCPFVPPGLKSRLDELQAGSTRSTGMTVQYFVKSAKEIGMRDVDDGVFIDLKRVGKVQEEQGNEVVPFQPYLADGRMGLGPREIIPRAAISGAPLPSGRVLSQGVGSSEVEGADPNSDVKKFHGKVLLALPDDESFLSPLRCFLRENVCAFSATARDIAVRTPTTFSVRVGQVGVGCVHCLAVPPKARSNRAVCFPFTVARIYQSVADIQRFHLGECRMMPPDVRAKFLKLQSESAKGSKGLATRTYWIDSAKKIGLDDGSAGMYFCRDPSLPPPPSDAFSLDILAQVATNVKTKSKPLVTPEDKPTIAEFLYVVMEQLQPCRFTDADRNKRRSKNLGSIGVECKHCAGKIDGRKFFWSSVSAAESNFVSVHSHMMDCKYIPDVMKVDLARLKTLRREQTSRLKTGSQKSFFTRVWNRLHAIKDAGSTEAEKELGDDEKAARFPNTNNVQMAPVKSEQSDVVKKDVKLAGTDDMSSQQKVKAEEIELQTGGSSESLQHDDIRALLESKSTLSSSPSGEEIMNKSARPDSESLDIDIGRIQNEVEMGRSSDSASHVAMDIASKSSLGSVARNMSAVSVRSKEDQTKVSKGTKL